MANKHEHPRVNRLQILYTCYLSIFIFVPVYARRNVIIKNNICIGIILQLNVTREKLCHFCDKIGNEFIFPVTLL